MQAYRGYYIGQGPNDFHSRAEIDEFLRQRAVKRLRLFTPQEVEDLEIEMMREAEQ